MKIPSVLIRATSRPVAVMNVVLLVVMVCVFVSGMILGAANDSLDVILLSAAMTLASTLIVGFVWVRPRRAITDPRNQAPRDDEFVVIAEGLGYGAPGSVASTGEVKGPMLIYVGSQGLRFAPLLSMVQGPIPANDVLAVDAVRVVPFAGFSKVLRIVTAAGITFDVYLIGRAPIWAVPPRDRDIEAVADTVRAKLGHR